MESLFHAALERAPGARQSFLEGACNGDASLRHRVEALLLTEEQAGGFLEISAMEDLTTGLIEGSLLAGNYRIMTALGAGGMGEVYRAYDNRLGRDVAIKVLPAGLAQEPERLARFRREARTLASLNHPNIAAIYGLVEEPGGADCLVLELVEGETLRGPLPLDGVRGAASMVARSISEMPPLVRLRTCASVRPSLDRWLNSRPVAL
ncbi:MAG: protein kinase [Nitrospirales bacterium]